MSRLKLITKNGQLSIRCALSFGESINNAELAFLSRSRMNGFMLPSAEGTKKIVYTGADGVALADFLARKINKDRFFVIMAQIVELYKSCVRCGLDMRKLVLDLGFIIINDKNGSLSFVYETVTNGKPCNNGIFGCMREIVSEAQFASQSDKDAAYAFIDMIRASGKFSVPEVESFIEEASPVTYGVVERTSFSEAVPAAEAPKQEQSEAMEAPVQEVYRGVPEDFAPKRDVHPEEPAAAEESTSFSVREIIAEAMNSREQ